MDAKDEEKKKTKKNSNLEELTEVELNGIVRRFCVASERMEEIIRTHLKGDPIASWTISQLDCFLFAYQ